MRAKCLRACKNMKSIHKKDCGSMFHEEQSRLNTVAWEKRKKTGNPGCNIVYDRKDVVKKIIFPSMIHNKLSISTHTPKK